jgi:shikimate kinase
VTRQRRASNGEDGDAAINAPDGRSSPPCLPVTLSPGHDASQTRCDLIALIGPRGSGKTTIARLLAERLGWGWVDADDVLEGRAGRSVRAIFGEAGEAGFRDHESAVLRELCGLKRHVIATGGGAVLREENRALLRASAWVVWLTADVETLWNRLDGDATSAERRPALLGGGRAEIAEVLRSREPLYRDCADRVVSTAARTPAEVVADIAAAGTGLPQSPSRE